MKGESRSRAAGVILEWIETGAFPDHRLADERKDRAFLMEVVYGAVKQVRRLDWLMARLTDRAPDAIIRAHLLAALYQVFHMDMVESYALVDETVEAVKRVRGKGGAGFVNAVLRRALREKEALAAALEREAPPAVRLSHPDPLAERWTARYGAARAEAIMAWDNARPAVTVRVQRSRIGLGELTARWTREGVPFAPHPAFPDRCLTLGKGIDPTRLPGWEEGVVAVQDPSTLMAVDLLDPQPGDRILDACAAPGGKLADIADRLGGGNGIVALDASRERLAMVHDNLARLKVEGAQIVAGDLNHPAVQKALAREGLFDRVLLDAPCTNTGVLRRRPDARWRFEADSASGMAQAQRQLLDAAARLVKPGGCLVYSTCSIEPEEDGDLVRVWLTGQNVWQLFRERLRLPGEQDADGAYAAVLS